jgi:hypothetical protein
VGSFTAAVKGPTIAGGRISAGQTEATTRISVPELASSSIPACSFLVYLHFWTGIPGTLSWLRELGHTTPRAPDTDVCPKSAS